MEKEKNANTKSAVLITILVMLVIALAGYIAYDKFLSTDTTKQLKITNNTMKVKPMITKP